MEQWDKIFKKYGKYFLEPHGTLSEIVKLFKKHHIKKVLALGCGSGRNIIYLAKQGFSVYGIDSSKVGIKIAKEWLKEDGHRAKFKVGSIYKKLPYRKNFFGAVLCIAALQHGKIKKIKKAIKEIERVLKPKGFLFLTVPREKPKLKTKEIETRTYLLFEGPERRLVHYIYNKRLLKKDFRNFKIHKIWIDYWGYLALLGELKG